MKMYLTVEGADNSCVLEVNKENLGKIDSIIDREIGRDSRAHQILHDARVSRHIRQVLLVVDNFIGKMVGYETKIDVTELFIGSIKEVAKEFGISFATMQTGISNRMIKLTPRMFVGVCVELYSSKGKDTELFDILRENMGRRNADWDREAIQYMRNRVRKVLNS